MNTLTDNNIAVFCRDGFIYIRSRFSDRHDLLLKAGEGPGNNQINFYAAFLISKDSSLDSAEGELIHKCDDDTPAWVGVNGETLAGNHASPSCRELVISNHTLTEKNLGQTLKTEDDHIFYIIKIIDENRIWVLGENLSDNPLVWDFDKNISDSTMVSLLAEPSRQFMVKTVKNTQLYPGSRINHRQFLINGATPIPENEVVVCDFLAGLEEYDVIAPDWILKKVKANSGKKINWAGADAESLITIGNTYTFRSHGSCLVHTRAKINRDITIGRILGVMTMKPGNENYLKRSLYIPKIAPFTCNGKLFDFRNIEPIGYSLLEASIPFAQKDWEYPENPPDRYIQLLDSGKTKFGFAIGFPYIYGDTRPEIKAKNTGSAGELAYTTKLYPNAVDDMKMPLIKKNTEFDFHAYRQYFNPLDYPEISSLYGYWLNGEYFLYIDCHDKFKDEKILLPEPLAGKDICVIEKTAGFTLENSRVNQDNNITFSVNEQYGFAVLKLS